MATPDLPQGHSPASNDDGEAPDARFPDRSRLEETLVKSSIWKKNTLRDIEDTRVLSVSLSNDPDTETARLLSRLSAQLEERNDEIERLRRAVSKLEKEKSRLDREHQRELDEHRTELELLQDAYDQFEQESDSLLAELSQQNERLLDEVRHENVRSMLER